MKKYGKRWRSKHENRNSKCEVISENSRSEPTQSDFSNTIKLLRELTLKKAKPDIRLCHHYRRKNMLMEEVGDDNRPIEELRISKTVYDFFPHLEAKRYFEVKESFLQQIDDTKCVCSNCQREFPVSHIQTMSKLFDRLNELGQMGVPSDFYLSNLQVIELHWMLEPTRYQIDSDQQITYLGTEPDPRKWSVAPADYRLTNLCNPLSDYPIACLPSNDKAGGRNRYFCKHYQGEPHGIGAYHLSVSNRDLPFPRIAGKAESLLFTNPYGICKCQRCRKIFSPQEQKQMEHLITYLNTPHYFHKEDMEYHNLWNAVLQFYDLGYSNDNEPYQLLNNEIVLKLSKGIEPVLYRETHDKRKAEVLKSLHCENGEWSI